MPSPIPFTANEIAGQIAKNTEPPGNPVYLKVTKLRDPKGTTARFLGHTGVVLETLGEVHHISFGTDQDGQVLAGYFFDNEVEPV